MALWDFWVKANGVDLATLGFAPSNLGGAWNPPVETYPEVAMPGRNGTTRTALEPTVEPVDEVIEGELTFASESAYEAGVSAFKRATRGDLTVIIGNQDTRQRTGYRKRLVVTPNVGEAITSAKVAMTVHFEDPVFYETSLTTVTGAAATDLALAQGDYRTWGVVTVTSATNPFTLTYKHYDGTTLASITIAAAGTVIVDMLNRTITVAGVRNDGARIAGDYFAFDGRHGDIALAHYPTLRTSVGSLSAGGGGIVYRKAWQ